MDYLIKASIVLAIFYFSYKWFLQHETFFNSNRFFLIIGLVFSALLPLIVIPLYKEVNPQPFPPLNLSNIEMASMPVIEGVSFTDILYVVYALGLLFFFGRLVINLWSLVKIIKGHSSENIEGINFVKTQNAIAPFSFFNWIVYNPNIFKADELQHIINHEQVHAKQWHSVDVIFSQLMCITFWFNPVVWFYKKALQQNLEFIADNQAQSKTDCNQSYQRLLLKASLPTHQLVMANNFYNSLIKKRIVMLHKSKSHKLKTWKFGIILPLLALFLMSFNTKTVFVNSTSSETQHINLNKTFSVTANTSNSEIKDIESYFSSKKVKVKFSGIKSNADKTIKKVTLKTNYDGGTKFVKRLTFGLDTSEMITPFSLTLSDDGMEILVQTSNADTAFISEELIRFDKQSGLSKKISEIGTETNTVSKDSIILIFLNDKEITREEMDQIDPNTIAMIDVIKEKNQLKKYGSKKIDGVILITTGKTLSKPLNIPEKALIFINDKESSKNEMEALDSDTIQSVFIIKPKMAKAKYGDKGKDGAIIVLTKK
ncbi:MAG: M56 family metallopeptidase [Xanthomarina sp.]